MRWYATLKCDGSQSDVLTRLSAMVTGDAKVRCYAVLKCDGHRFRESAMVRRTKLRRSHVMRKCDDLHFSISYL